MSPPAFFSGIFPAPSVRHGKPHRITARHHAAGDGHHDGIPVSIDSTAGLDISE